MTSRLEQFKPVEFDEETPIATGAVVRLIDGMDRERWVFMVPAAPGYQLNWHGHQVVSITLKSPLGAELVEKQCGDEVEITLGGELVTYEVCQLI